MVWVDLWKRLKDKTILDCHSNVMTLSFVLLLMLVFHVIWSFLVVQTSRVKVVSWSQTNAGCNQRARAIHATCSMLVSWQFSHCYGDLSGKVKVVSRHYISKVGLGRHRPCCCSKRDMCFIVKPLRQSISFGTLANL